MKVLKWVGLAAIALLLILAISFVVLLGPKDSSSTVGRVIKIEAGLGRAEVAEQLAEAGVIRSSFAFYVYSRLLGGKILPGSYEISPSQSGSVIAEILKTGRIKTTRITTIEGWRLTDMEKYLVDEKKLTQFVGFAGMNQADEGRLFPDTYEIAIDATSEALAGLMKDNFTKRTEALKLTPEALILASIVEREAKTDEERPLIAAVYANRLKIKMKLQADPTIQYAKGNWKAITTADYSQVISSYNTYLHDGLPPGPICNPGLKSIEAALSPSVHSYYFFFHAQGELYLSKTFEEHAAKVRRFF